MMVTKIELDRDSKPARVYHRGGLATGGGKTYAWTHAADPATRAQCEQCRGANR